jgi:hypothetical protein
VSADTLVLPVSDAAGDDPPNGEFQLRGDRCVVELVLRLLGLPILRVRLQAVAGGLATAGPSLLWAELSDRPLFASLPFARRWRLSATTGTARICLRTANAPSGIGPGDTVRIDATVTAGEHTWPAELQVRLVVLDEHVAIVAVRGKVRRTPGVLPRDSYVWIDAAAEFVR